MNSEKDLFIWGSALLLCFFVVCALLLAISMVRRLMKKHQLRREMQLEAKGTNSPDKNERRSTDIRMGETVIRRIDTLDTFAASLESSEAARDIVRQLRALRSDLVDLLREHQIESYRFPEGMELDASTRKLIIVAESITAESGDRPEIHETLRPGYRYVGENPEVIRKAEVKVSEPATTATA